MTINYPDRKIKTLLKQLLQAGLVAADPSAAIQRSCNVNHDTLTIGRKRYRLSQYERIACLGIGKASEKMAHGLHKLLGNRLNGGLLVVKDLPSRPLKHMVIHQAGHPTPNSQSLQAAKAVQRFSKSFTAQDLLIVLISGGTSSLLASPAPGLTLKDKQRTTNLLLRSGASIHEMNVVRKHLSAIKGGRLITCIQANILTFILSDVLGNNLGTIGSGLTAPDTSSFLEARHILHKYHLLDRMPVSVKRHIAMGTQGKIPETLKPQNPHFKRVHHVIIGDNQRAVQHIAKRAKQLGIHPIIQNATLQGEAKEMGKHIALFAKNIHRGKQPMARPACVIWGGEPTVTLTSKSTGKGGRAQECALSAAIEMSGLPNMIMAGLGTDGADGPTDMAGAIVDGQTVQKAASNGINADHALKSHDSYSFFEQVGGHIQTGPTGTNVNDIYLLLAF